MKDNYEILLLEIRQQVRDLEGSLKTTACVDLARFKALKIVKSLIQQELVKYRIGQSADSKAFISLLEG